MMNEASLGQWMQVTIAGIVRLAHVQFSTDGVRKAYSVTCYKGNRETGEMLSGAYWKATSDVSAEHAFQLLSTIVAADPEPEEPLALAPPPL
jgi:hypothetical protein